MATMVPARDTRPPIHASNAWNPTGQNLLPVPGARLYYAHARRLSGERTLVFLGSQRHLTFVADLEGYLPVGQVREQMVTSSRLYPHQVELEHPLTLAREREREHEGRRW